VPDLSAEAMREPTAVAWFRTVDVIATDPDIVDVHVGTSPDFAPCADTYRGTLYGPGVWHVPGLTAGVDYYARLVDLAGHVSDPSMPARPTVLVRPKP
jgi:hypothetical protein